MNTKCGICLSETWIRPVTLFCCGNTYCKKCLKDLPKENGKRGCPSCRASFTNKIRSLTPNVFLCNFIEDKTINCEYCEIELLHKNYNDHLRNCEKLTVQCDHIINTIKCDKDNIINIGGMDTILGANMEIKIICNKKVENLKKHKEKVHSVEVNDYISNSNQDIMLRMINVIENTMGDTRNRFDWNRGVRM
ncbi:MAG: hypothetical protein JST07_11240 [Bacteroidetes bacterium]|nr:hypothetical protein [Bacteroidota bacterium]